MTWQVSADVWSAIAFQEAIDFMQERIPSLRPSLEEIEAGAAAEAFWISDVASLSVISSVYESLTRAVDAGTPLQEWADDVRDALSVAYPSDMTQAQIDQRIVTIGRNAMQRAYSEGRYAQAQDPAVQRARPYFMYDAILDARTTEGCRELNGVIREQSDPFWDSNTPPRHHRCRAGLRTLSARQVEARGGPTMVLPDVETSPGFGARPGTQPPYRPAPDRYPPELQSVLAERAASRGAT